MGSVWVKVSRKEIVWFLGVLLGVKKVEVGDGLDWRSGGV